MLIIFSARKQGNLGHTKILCTHLYTRTTAIFWEVWGKFQWLTNGHITIYSSGPFHPRICIHLYAFYERNVLNVLSQGHYAFFLTCSWIFLHTNCFLFCFLRDFFVSIGIIPIVSHLRSKQVFCFSNLKSFFLISTTTFSHSRSVRCSKQNNIAHF